MKELRFYYKQLSVVDKLVYDTLYKGIVNHERQVMVMGISAQVKKILPMIFWDCPELFYVDTTTYSSLSVGISTKVELSYHKDITQSRLIEQKLKKLADQFLMEIGRKRMNNLMVVKFAHDFIIRNISYSHESLRMGQAAGDVSSITGVFFKKSAVCMGISLAFKWLLDVAGIPSAVIEGSTSDFNNFGAGENNHAWNLVCVNDEWYHVDVTMDLGATTSKDWISYDYFLRGSDEMKKAYVSFEYPAVTCCDIRGTYFARNKVVLHEAEQIEKYVSYCCTNRKRRIYFQVKGNAERISKEQIVSLVKKKYGGTFRYRDNPRFSIYDFWLQ